LGQLGKKLDKKICRHYSFIGFGYNQGTFCDHLVARIHDAPHAHKPHAAHAHVPEAPVLSGPHVHLLASVLGLLVHQPVAVHHVARLAVVHAVTVHDVVAVVHHLVALTPEVLILVDLHPELSPVLF